MPKYCEFCGFIIFEYEKYLGDIENGYVHLECVNNHNEEIDDNI